MYVIGITGGIACGKSMVSNEMKKYGCKIINADSMAHWQMAPYGEIYNAYIEHFGREILNEYELIDRRIVAEKVFNNEKELQWINNLTHPILLKYLRQRLVDYQDRGVPITILDVPLLFEAGWDKECDEVWVVHLKRSLQIKRLMVRNDLTQEEAERRIDVQLTSDERRRRADVVISNSKNKKATRVQVHKLMRYKFPHLIENYERYLNKFISNILNQEYKIE